MEGLRKTSRRPQTRSTVQETEGAEACASDVPFEGQTHRKEVVEVEVHHGRDTSQPPELPEGSTARESRSREILFNRAMSEDPEVSDAAVREYAEQYISDPTQVEAIMAARARTPEQNLTQVDVRPKTTSAGMGLEQTTAAVHTSTSVDGRIAPRHQPFARPDVAAQRQAQQDLVAALNQNQERVAAIARARTATPYQGGRPRTSNQETRARAASPLTREVLDEVIERTVRNTVELMEQSRNPRRTPPGIRLGSNHGPRSQSESSGDDDSHASSRTAVRPQFSPKLPPFTGKEKWEVWFTRFTDVASLNQWGDRRQLQELLPRLQGPAGDFVYSQLPADARSSYGRLVRELNSRFQVVETRKTYAAQFSNRTQKPGETTEEFAAELRRLYNKAYPSRDAQTRKEDLLRKFLDGLYDERARFHIEFVKEPDSIDQAIYEAVNFQETRRRPPGKEGRVNRPTRAVYNHYSSDSDEDSSEMVQPADSDDSDEERIARVPSKAGKSKKITRVDQTAKSSKSPSQAVESVKSSNTTEEYKKLLEELEKLKLQLSQQDSRATGTRSGGARSVNPND